MTSTATAIRSTRRAPTASATRTAPTSSTCRGTRSCPIRSRRTDNAFGQGPAQRLAAVGHLDVRERHADLARLRRPGRQRRHRAGLLRHAGHRPADRRTAASRDGLAPVYTCDPRARRHARSARSCSTSTASASRRSARSATCCRRTTSGRRPGMNHDITLFKNFAIHGRPEAAVPRRVLQHLQPGVRHARAVDRNDIDLTLEHHLQPRR